MEKVIRILILEDNPVDVELIQFEMQEAGLVFTSKVVMTEEDFIREIQELSPDLILSDYDLPHYNGAAALAEARRRCPDTPFILVTGAVTEDRAIDILTQGAKDYVLKNRLQQRLVPAVRRALAEATEHRARQEAELELREAHRQLQTMLNLYHRADTHIQDIEAFVIEECIKISESLLGFFGFINEDETAMRTHLWSKQAMEGCAIDFKPVEFSINHAGIWAEAIRKHEILIVNDYPKPDSRKKGYPEGHVPIKSLMSIPIIKGGKAVAIMAVANKKMDYNETDVLHLSLFLESAWDILKRMEAEEKLKNRIKELNCLYSISEVVRRNDIEHDTSDAA
jgi:CheY-like chemotaxis protein